MRMERRKDNEEKIINRISEGLTGLVLRDYKDETIEIFKQELKKSYDELEHMIKKENTIANHCYYLNNSN